MRASRRPNSSTPWPLNPSTGRASSPQTLYKPKFATEPAGRALELSLEHKERGHQAWALRLLGEIHSHRGLLDAQQAEASYQQALALAEELGMRPLQAHCHRGLGILYGTLGQQEPARAELSLAIELYKAMEMAFWLPEAERALAEVQRP